ncbi:mitogen-activated protein kinase kinase kinase 17-like [Musa acuminata AAA Group]|uniref:mitogen-activated protein kinase kinase kinase 17-like n=1 Tax=Musa acuminata AAA Group TaxID=214697 RepID=UPI0031D888D8
MLSRNKPPRAGSLSRPLQTFLFHPTFSLSRSGMGIGGWHRGQVIGRGSSATVFLATALTSGEVFAVKSAELSRSAILQREQRILCSLDSPYVISCFGFDLSLPTPSGGLYYDLFMEYAPGGSLSDEIARRGGRLDEVAIRTHACDVLRGLAYLHSRGVVHCDVKGRNVLIGSDGRAKIADLGCASRIRGDEEEVEGDCQRLRGTPMFMAPEVARGEEQGPAADLWALGCTIIEMATGRPPWPDVSDPVIAIHRIAFSQETPRFPSWLSGEGKDFLSKCLRRDPRERWTAEQLLHHEFVASSSKHCPRSKPDADRSWVSPKSTLDQASWESLPEQDEETVEHLDDPSARIQPLVCSCGPNWTWEENWSTVRRDGDPIELMSWNSTGRADSTTDSPHSSHCSIDGNGNTSNSCNTSLAFVSRQREARFSESGNVSDNHEQRIQSKICYWLVCFHLIGYRLSSFPFCRCCCLICHARREMRGVLND